MVQSQDAKTVGSPAPAASSAAASPTQSQGARHQNQAPQPPTAAPTQTVRQPVAQSFPQFGTPNLSQSLPATTGLATPIETPKVVAEGQQNQIRSLPPVSDRREADQPPDRLIGRVTHCSGARATISTAATNLTGATSDFWSVGRLISIDLGVSRVAALVYEMKTDNAFWDDDNANAVSVSVEIVGEVSKDDNGVDRFRRGVSRYPQIGAIAHKIRVSDLATMHDLGDRRSVEIGRLTQNADVPATVSVEDMLRKHFAVVGTTGVGKSCSLTLLIRQCLAVKPELRVVLLDPHNEFSRAFSTEAALLDASTLELPYWLFKFDELEDVVFRGKTIADEADILRDLIALSKAQFSDEKLGRVNQGTLRKSADPGNFNADSPSPYRMSDLFKLIDTILGHLDPRFDRVLLKSLRVRLDSLANDKRYEFMFPKGMLTDNFAHIISIIFRLPSSGKPVSIINLSGLPSDVTNAVVSVLARLSFDVAYASEGSVHVLLVCEEAHRYVPQDVSAGFIPTRRAIARIAKEGRKYGCSIAVVSQRPGELDPTILSQCSTIFAMRLSNDRDQEIMRSAISDSGSSTISFLSALDNREAIVFGEGVATPMRFKFTFQEGAQLPSAPGTTIAHQKVEAVARNTIPDASLLVVRLRGGSEVADVAASPILAGAASPLMRRAGPATSAQQEPNARAPQQAIAGTPLRLNPAGPGGAALFGK